MHAIVATDGSRASLLGARQFKWIADSREVKDVTVVAVVSPYSAVPFANELGDARAPKPTELSFGEEARLAVELVAAEFDGWGPSIHKQVRSGSPAQEIIRRAEDVDADLISLASGSRGPDDPARQHRLPRAALGALPGAGLPPHPEQRARHRLSRVSSSSS